MYLFLDNVLHMYSTFWSHSFLYHLHSSVPTSTYPFLFPSTPDPLSRPLALLLLCDPLVLTRATPMGMGVKLSTTVLAHTSGYITENSNFLSHSSPCQPLTPPRGWGFMSSSPSMTKCLLASSWAALSKKQHLLWIRECHGRGTAKTAPFSSAQLLCPFTPLPHCFQNLGEGDRSLCINHHLLLFLKSRKAFCSRWELT